MLLQVLLLNGLASVSLALEHAMTRYRWSFITVVLV